MAFPPRYCSGDFAPLFRFLDDYDMHQSTRRTSHKKVTNVKTFAPRFDVYEQGDRYYLDGELPGVEQSNIEIEFTDPQTLVIKGRSERKYHKEQRSEPDNYDGSETSSVKSLQPTVEDWDEMSDAAPAAERTSASTYKGKAVEKTSNPKRHEPACKFWASERSIGEFHRTFAFPTRVDQDSVKASLNNGILSVVLPKEPAPLLKKVRIE
ncbi:Hsp20/alpha crystallin family protein [Aspergillus mulundensis]|uniref:Heat-shock protein n=1 Tax=Aspergillus mulundensis TaxID=1810919 RepID=A0A3D8Q6F8_9EURO|nr:Heat-shock protein [Aspergillus mulundensis]RDW57416.1 Heat-shock protein [Aspergillus mulundensis]